MDIEIILVGESSKWVLNQAHIRIGQDPNCEVSLPAERYPAVSGEHAALDVADGTVRLVKGMRASGDTFLNGHPAGSGATVHSGDVLRLGTGGPELRIRLLEREADARPSEHEPTRVISQPGAASPQPTRMMHEPTRVISGPAATSYSPSPPSASGAGKQGYSAPAVHGVSSTPKVPPAQAAAPRAAESGNMHSLEEKLKMVRLILVANLALLVLMFVWAFLQGQELAQTHKDLQAFRAQAQTAVGQFTPALDQRLSAFDQRMDAMDAKVAAAQDRMVKGMDAQEKVAEDHLINRMNKEIPAMLDKYIAKMRAGMNQR